jgi:Na+/melibiose symporter-like transporter
MKKILFTLMVLALGSIIGYFGVLVSVFSDADSSERLTTIGIILLIYIIVSALNGFFMPDYSWLWGLLLGIPGVILLILYFAREPNLYYIVYIFLVLGLSCLSAKGGSFIKTRNKNKNR